MRSEIASISSDLVCLILPWYLRDINGNFREISVHMQDIGANVQLFLCP